MSLPARENWQSIPYADLRPSELDAMTTEERRWYLTWRVAQKGTPSNVKEGDDG